eukprot:gnl/Hemi2/19454_TR6464_c0_g1_i1.p1 gnl/Hemi2/19454_TR6464_c0_g1~~gnl/Hemi2/19454_TR6464_c0_g1_i1.p1  ORF type:complete len:242 (-),score=120.12 gnl/Hemi2/19454_TR6464_c0_g1_i1:361-1086(-)
MAVLKAFLLVLVVAVSLVAAAKKELAVETHILTGLPAGHADVQTGSIFPAMPDSRFPSGEVIDILVGFSNNANETLNVTAIAGSVNAPHDFRLHIQNFTISRPYQLVSGNSEASLVYYFKPDAMLDPREYVVAITVLYEDEAGNKFSNTVFNDTIEIYEPESAFDARAVFTYTAVLGSLGVVALLGYKVLQNIQKKQRRSRVVETGTTKKGQSANDNSDWLEGIVPKKPARTSTSPVAKRQ